MSMHDALKRLIELHHGNINRFIGVCLIDEITFKTVWEYCQKGSLDNFLLNDNINIDETFQYSIMNDIAQGMKYLHRSQDIDYHGNLRSSTCLVDHRFTIKLSSYCLHKIIDNLNLTSSDYVTEQSKKRLYLSPELLRNEVSTMVIIV